MSAFGGGLFCCIHDTEVYAPEEIPERLEISKEPDAGYTEPGPGNVASRQWDIHGTVNVLEDL